MRKKSDEPGDRLFARTPSAIKRLHARSKKELRDKARRKWKAEHGQH